MKEKLKFATRAVLALFRKSESTDLQQKGDEYLSWDEAVRELARQLSELQQKGDKHRTLDDTEPTDLEQKGSRHRAWQETLASGMDVARLLWETMTEIWGMLRKGQITPIDVVKSLWAKDEPPPTDLEQRG